MIHIAWGKRGRGGLVVLGLALMACGETSGPARAETEPPTFDGPTLFRGLMLGNGEAADFLANRARTPRLADLVSDPAQLAQITRFQDRLIAAIDSVNPGFFTEFAQAITSGDHLRIQEMLRQAADVTFRTLLTLEETRRVRAALANPKAVQAAVDQRLTKIGRNDPEARAAVRQALEALYAASDPKSDVGVIYRYPDVDEGGGGGGGGGTTYVYAVVAAVYYVAAVNFAVAVNSVVTISIGTYLAIGSNTPLAPKTELEHERLVHTVATTLAVTPRLGSKQPWL